MPNIIDHGTWVTYKPERLPSNAPPNTLFARRESDGMDWYVYLHSGKNFKKDTVKHVLDTKSDGTVVIRVSHVEADRIFPADCRLIEIVDVIRKQDETNLIDEFCNKEIDLISGRVGKLWQDPDLPKALNVQMLLEDIVTRLGNLERKVNGSSTAVKPKGGKRSKAVDR